MGYNSITDQCVDLLLELNHIHDFSNYIVDGQYCALKSGTTLKLRLFIKWMSTGMKDITFELSDEYLLALTYEDFNVFGQADMIKMMSSSTLPPTTPLTSQASGSKTNKLSFPNLMIYLMSLFFNLLKPYLIKKRSILPIFTISIFFQFSWKQEKPYQSSLHFNHKTPLVLPLCLLLNLKEIWTMPTFHKQIFFDRQEYELLVPTQSRD